jgi:holin-like protein
MINALLVLLVYQLIGEVLARTLSLPLPGPVLGMLLLFATLFLRGGIPTPLRATAETLLQHLALLFVPAGVGIMVHLNLLRNHWLPILATLILGTLLTMSVTALILNSALSMTQRRNGDE